MSLPTRSNNPMDAPHNNDRMPKAWHGSRPDWTTTPPTEPGWYWVDEGGFDEPQIVCVVSRPMGLIAMHPFGDDEQPLSDFDYWIGPLPVPEPPETLANLRVEFVKTGDFLFDGQTMMPAPEPPKE